MANKNDLVTNNCIYRRCYVRQTIGLCHTYLVLNFGWRGVKLLSHSIVNNSSRANVNASEVVCRRRNAGPTYQNSKNITPKIKTLKHDICLLLLIRQMMSPTSIVVFEVIQHIKNVLNWSEANWADKNAKFRRWLWFFSILFFVWCEIWKKMILCTSAIKQTIWYTSDIGYSPNAGIYMRTLKIMSGKITHHLVPLLKVLIKMK